eukprot:m.418479 g.418479  ORF g.418479 m.418479 type:complete len:342 (-) comp30963_c0_seq1:119-1144(-)
MANPYDGLPTVSAPSGPSGAGAAVPRGTKRSAPDGLPEGWKRVPSRSRPGQFTYENQFTKERISWIPDCAASRTPKNLPPEPKRAPKPARSSDPEEAQKQSVAKLKVFLEKIKVYLATEEKFGAACKLLHKSLFSSAALSADISDLYFDALKATQAVPERCYADKDRRIVKHVFKVVREKKDAFPKAQHFQLDTWILRSVTHNELYTDDSYEFNRATKEFTDAVLEAELRGKKRIIEQLGTEADNLLRDLEAVPPEQLTERKRVIVEILGTIHKQAKLPWAISTCNSVFKHITDHRSIFEPDEQAIIDNANDVRSGKKAPPRKEDHTGSLQGRVLARQTKF